MILLMITNSKKSHYFAVTNLSTLLKGISSNHKEDFYCLIYLFHIHQKINLKNIKKYAIKTTAVT